ncbi:MAG: glycosyltransferase [Ardenticatenaceae bacterium]|nr:glycosyltransferase [Ardenticatenaceae bacterium]
MISVVIPAYNAARTLPACLDALNDQTVPRDQYEVIVVNDGSTDATGQLARERGAIVIDQPNQGSSAAKNTGVRAARGDLVLFVDADCVPVRDWVAHLTCAMFDPTVAAARGSLDTRQWSGVALFTQVEREEKDALQARLREIAFVPSVTAAFRRDALLAVGLFNTSLPTDEDAELSFRMIEHGYRMIYVPAARVYHVHPEHVSEYFRRKFRYAYWRIQIHRRFPQRIINDTFTPQTQKVQVLLFYLLLAFLPFFPFSRRARRGFLLTLGGFLVTSLRLIKFAWQRRGRRVALWVVPMLFVRAAAGGFGLLVGLLDEVRRQER